MDIDQQEALEAKKRIFVRELVVGAGVLLAAYGLASYFFLRDRVRVEWVDDAAELLYLAPSSKAIYALPLIVAAIIAYVRLQDIARSDVIEKLKVIRTTCLIVLAATIISSVSRVGLYMPVVQRQLPSDYSLWVQAHAPLMTIPMDYKWICTEAKLRKERYGDYSQIDMSRLPERLRFCDFSGDGSVYLTDQGKAHVEERLMTFSHHEDFKVYGYIESIMILIVSVFSTFIAELVRKRKAITDRVKK